MLATAQMQFLMDVSWKAAAGTAKLAGAILGALPSSSASENMGDHGSDK